MRWLRKLFRPESVRASRVLPAHFEGLGDGPPLERLHRWLDRSSVATASASEATIAALEGRYDLRLPDDFRHYLATMAPVEENMDDEGTKWWPLHEIKNVRDELHEPHHEGSKWLIFADYLAWCYAWAIVCADDARHCTVMLITGGRDVPVADSFTDFLDKYLADDPSLHGA